MCEKTKYHYCILMPLQGRIGVSETIRVFDVKSVGFTSNCFRCVACVCACACAYKQITLDLCIQILG